MIRNDLVVNAKDAHNVVTICQIFLTIITAVIEAQCDLKYINEFREEMHVIFDAGVASLQIANVSG